MAVHLDRDQICHNVSAWVRRVVKEMLPGLLDARQAPNEPVRICLWEEFDTITVQLFIRVKPSGLTDISTAGRLLRAMSDTYWHHCYWDKATAGPKVTNSLNGPEFALTINAERDDEHPKP